ncbi:hypothetical protein FRB99_004188 [Tulasnella sp. 403]|nr:hypothetical protein FRB99_004188 [Tulasnella sp. 403]
MSPFADVSLHDAPYPITDTSRNEQQRFTFQPRYNPQWTTTPNHNFHPTNYHLGTPGSASTSSFSSSSFSPSPPALEVVPDPYSYQNVSAHLPSRIQEQPVWPSSAPSMFPDMLGGSFYQSIAGLGISSPLKPLNTISPKDVMASAQMVDADDFATSPIPQSATVDYPAVDIANNFASSYPGYNTRTITTNDFGAIAAAAAAASVDDPRATYQPSSMLSYDLFANSPSNTFLHPSAAPSTTSPNDMQFPIDMDDIELHSKPIAISTAFAHSSHDQSSSPTSTIRIKRSSGARQGLALGPSDVIDSAFNAQLPRSAWPPSHPQSSPDDPARPRRATALAARLFNPDPVDQHSQPVKSDADHDEEDDAEGDEDEEDDEDDGDGDYVDHSYGLGPHRTVRRGSSSVLSHPSFGSSGGVTPSSSLPKPRRASPYSRSSRPSSGNRRHSHSAGDNLNARDTIKTNLGVANKKVKTVKWESTKPKYWIPEGFDPWWDQKSRGRGVQTVSDNARSNASDADDRVGADGAWPVNYLPEDWRELIRGKGNPARPFVCPAVNCGKTFQRSEHAKRHAWSLHTPDAVKVSCPFEGCDHKSTRGDNLKQHIGSHKRKKDHLSAAALANPATMSAINAALLATTKRTSGLASARRKANLSVKHEEPELEDDGVSALTSWA